VRIFIGIDPRQPIAFFALQASIIRKATQPVSITPLILAQLPMKRRGLTEFTYSRFLVPYLCGYQGAALFLDADMIMLEDVGKLFALYDEQYSVQVVKNSLKFEWPSMMLFNCEKCSELTIDFIENQNPFAFTWGDVGELPSEWNHLVGYDAQRTDAKLVHFTQGIPVFPEVEDCEYSEEWKVEHRAMNSTVSWKEIMGESVHAEPVIRRLIDAGKMSLVQSTASH